MINFDKQMRVSRKGAVIAANVTVVALLLVAIVSHLRIAELNRQSAARSLEISGAEARLLGYQNEAAASISDERLIFDVLGCGRVAADIPHFNCDRIVTVRSRGKSGVFYVPEGKHELFVTTVCTEVFSPSAPTADASVSQSWMIPLVPDTGYRLDGISGSRYEPFRLTLSSNRPEFEARKLDLGIGRFQRSGIPSWRHRDAIVFPGLINVVDFQKARRNNQPIPVSVPLVDAGMDGKVGDKRYRVQVDAVILSDVPLSIDPVQKREFISMGFGDLMLPYAGDGRIVLTERSAPLDHSP